MGTLGAVRRATSSSTASPWRNPDGRAQVGTPKHINARSKMPTTRWPMRDAGGVKPRTPGLATANEWPICPMGADMPNG